MVNTDPLSVRKGKMLNPKMKYKVERQGAFVTDEIRKKAAVNLEVIIMGDGALDWS